MPLEKKTSSNKPGNLELDLDALNLDMVSERYKAHLEELQAWFNITGEALKTDSEYEQSWGHAKGSHKSSPK